MLYGLLADNGWDDVRELDDGSGCSGGRLFDDGSNLDDGSEEEDDDEVDDGNNLDDGNELDEHSNDDNKWDYEILGIMTQMWMTLINWVMLANGMIIKN